MSNFLSAAVEEYGLRCGYVCLRLDCVPADPREAREKILHGFRWIPWRIFRVEYWNELPWTISSFSTADRRIIFLDIVHGVFPWIPWNVSMDCGFGPCFPWTVSTDKMSSFVHGVHGKLSVWSIETLFHGKFPCFPLQASFPFMDNVHGECPRIPWNYSMLSMDKINDIVLTITHAVIGQNSSCPYLQCNCSL